MIFCGWFFRTLAFLWMMLLWLPIRLSFVFLLVCLGRVLDIKDFEAFVM